MPTATRRIVMDMVVAYSGTTSGATGKGTQRRRRP
jgi:hypothetical protein